MNSKTLPIIIQAEVVRPEPIRSDFLHAIFWRSAISGRWHQAHIDNPEDHGLAAGMYQNNVTSFGIENVIMLRFPKPPTKAE